ncbi:MAG: response regulator [SAR324 cluster bacterium]|nr:response regulator [SAR324 cluster bacterium]
MSNTQILIVEDEVFIALGIKKQLENFGYYVLGIASSGDEALSKIVEARPDLVLMDIVIKGEMDGIEVAKRIHDQFEIPIIYLTAYSDHANLQRAKTTEPFGYLLKPFNDRELQITIEIALYKDRVQKRMTDQQRWYSSILNSLGEAVITMDVHQTVLFLNPVAETIFQLKKQDSVGRSLMEACSLCSQVPDLEQLVTKVLNEQGTVRKSNLCYETLDTRIILDLCITPIRNEEGALKGVVLIFSDKTEQNQMELLIKKTVPDLEQDILFPSLTLREKQVLEHIVEGEATKVIADSLNISPRTVEFHRYNLMRKFNVQDIPSLVRHAISKQLVPVN